MYGGTVVNALFRHCRVVDRKVPGADPGRGPGWGARLLLFPPGAGAPGASAGRWKV